MNSISCLVPVGVAIHHAHTHSPLYPPPRVFPHIPLHVSPPLVPPHLANTKHNQRPPKKTHTQALLESITDCIRVIEKACGQVRNSKRLALTLQSILLVGNEMNAGTARGNASGVRIDCLPKLADIKVGVGVVVLHVFLGVVCVRCVCVYCVLGVCKKRRGSGALCGQCKCKCNQMNANFSITTTTGDYEQRQCTDG